MTNGTCKLTGRKGKFVKAHIIPKAFTRLEKPGASITQSVSGIPDKRKWDSWYDKKLVTREGEDILEELDDFAIKYLREQKLVWSGWGPMKELPSRHDQKTGAGWGLRTVEIEDSDKLRLFFLSLLWRAAATSLQEFAEVSLPSDDLEKLRLMLLGGRTSPLSFYPASLIQLSTLGPIHNHSPIKQLKINPDTDETREKK